MILLDKLIHIKSGSLENQKILNEDNINSFDLSEKQLRSLKEILQNGIIQIKNKIDDKFFLELIALNCVSYLNNNKSIVHKEITVENKPIINNQVKSKRIVDDSKISDDTTFSSKYIYSLLSKKKSRKPSGLRKTTCFPNSLAHKTKWL